MRPSSSLTAVLAVLICTIGASDGLAQLGSRPADEWIERLSRPARVKELQIDEVIDRLRVRAGDRVADIGAGAGVFSLPLARAVSPGGTVYAVEVDQALVDHINAAARSANAANVKGVLGEFTDPNLPSREIGLAFFHDVLHHVESRAAYLKTLAGYLGPDGRIAVIERTDVHRHGRDRELQMTKEQVTAWMAAAGFRPSEEHYLFGDEKWFVVYARD